MQAIHEHILVRVPRPKTEEAGIQLPQHSVLASHAHGRVESVGSAVAQVKVGDIVLFDTDGGVRDIERPIEVGKQRTTARRLPLELRAKRGAVDRNEHEIALATKMLHGGLGDLLGG